jgi:hypothetical protein
MKLEHLPEKWVPVFSQKMRSNKESRALSDSTQLESALVTCNIRIQLSRLDGGRSVPTAFGTQGMTEANIAAVSGQAAGQIITDICCDKEGNNNGIRNIRAPKTGVIRGCPPGDGDSLSRIR